MRPALVLVFLAPALTMAVALACNSTGPGVIDAGPVSSAAAPGCPRACDRLHVLCGVELAACSCVGLPAVCVSAAGDAEAVRACGVPCSPR